jgi:hypothetical protein
MRARASFHPLAPSLLNLGERGRLEKLAGNMKAPGFDPGLEKVLNTACEAILE